MRYIQQKLLKSRGYAHRSWKIIQFHSSRISLKTYLLYIFCIPAISGDFASDALRAFANSSLRSFHTSLVNKGCQRLWDAAPASRRENQRWLSMAKGFGRCKGQNSRHWRMLLWKWDNVFFWIKKSLYYWLLLYTIPPFYNLSEFPKSETDLAPVVDLDFRWHDTLLSFPCGFSLKMAANKTNFADTSTRRYIATAVAPAKFVEVVDSLWCFLMP